jgi:hypothetical protein
MNYELVLYICLYFVPVLPPSVEGSCATIRVKALQLGNTEVHVVYQTKKIRLDATVTIAAHLPLKASEEDLHFG